MNLQPEQVEVQRAEDQVQDVALLQDCVDVTAGRGHLLLGDPRRFQIDRQRDLPIDLAILLSFPVDPCRSAARRRLTGRPPHQSGQW